MTLIKFEELGIEVDGVPATITTNLIGFMPVFGSLKEAKKAGWLHAIPVTIGEKDDQ